MKINEKVNYGRNVSRRNHGRQKKGPFVMTPFEENYIFQYALYFTKTADRQTRIQKPLTGFPGASVSKASVILSCVQGTARATNYLNYHQH
jgi:hypothetical protein